MQRVQIADTTQQTMNDNKQTLTCRSDSHYSPEPPPAQPSADRVQPSWRQTGVVPARLS